jgi:hypothetical protein
MVAALFPMVGCDPFVVIPALSATRYGIVTMLLVTGALRELRPIPPKAGKALPCIRSLFGAVRQRFRRRPVDRY